MKSVENKKNKKEQSWIILITVLAFIISFGLSLISELIIPNTFLVINIILVLLFILLGIIFDIIGVAVTTADEKSFHSMAARKLNGAKTAINFINNKEKVSSFCNDVIGDICGVLSGSCGLAIAIKVSDLLDIKLLVCTVLITSIISALTIGGKAFGKKIAVNNSNKIVYAITKILNIYKR